MHQERAHCQEENQEENLEENFAFLCQEFKMPVLVSGATGKTGGLIVEEGLSQPPEITYLLFVF